MDNYSKTPHDEDSLTLLEVANGDILAFEKLYKKYYPIVIDYLANLNGYQDSLKDITQIVFLRIWENKTRYRADSIAKTYILGIARNVLSEESKHWLKEAKVIQEWPLEQKIEFSIYRSSKIDNNTEIATSLIHLLSKLTVEQKQAVELIHQKNMNLYSAAKEAGCSVEAFKSRLKRAHKKLRQLSKYLEN
jgi:RNA polymerase sigma-70 factor (ECF subfamily)